MKKIVGSSIGDFYLSETAPEDGSLFLRNSEVTLIKDALEIFEGEVVEVEFDGKVVKGPGYVEVRTQREKVEAFLKGRQSSPIVDGKKAENFRANRAHIIYGEVTYVNVKTKGAGEYVVVHFSNEHGKGYAYFDKKFTRKHKALLVALVDSLALFVVKRNDDGFVNGICFAVVEKEVE